MARQKKSIREKVEKSFPDFPNEVDGLSIADLEKRLSNFAKATAEWDEKQANDEDLQDLKDQVSERTKDYTEPKKELKLKSAYMASLIKEKGGQ